MLRFIAYLPLGTAVCLIALDVTLISYTSFVEPEFFYAGYFGISSILAVFFAVIGRYSVGAAERKKIAFNYDKIAKTAYRMELDDSRRSQPRVATASVDDEPASLKIAQAS